MEILPLKLLLCISLLPNHSVEAEDLAARERDFSQFEETCEYEGVPQSGSILKRWWVYKHTESQALAPCPEDLDDRREAMLDAIWKEEASSFNELAKSPTTGEGKLENQEFSKIVSELKKMDRWPLRTMRSHPTVPANAVGVLVITSFHQLMTLPKADKTPRRGNLNLIFRRADWSLAFVRVNWFDNDKVNLLPRPDSSIDNDPVVDRGVPRDERYRPE